MNRRTFLHTCILATAGSWMHSASAETQTARVMTVDGWIDASDMGSTLSHEHVMCDFIGAEGVSPDRYDADEVVEVVQPYLEDARSLGCRTFIECTPAFIGRDARVIQRLSRNTGLHMLTNTGYYGAANDKYIPGFAYRESARQLADRWIHEWKNGIGDTGIRPGFIKIGVDSGPLSDIDAKLVHAAALAHRATGLCIAAHTGDGVAALEQLDILEERGVSPTAWVWVHGQNEKDTSFHRRAAERGGWLSFDAVSPVNTPGHLALVLNMSRHGFINQVLVSHDAGWYSVGEERGGSFRHFNEVYRRFLPALKREGMPDEQVNQLMTLNPARAFCVSVREHG